jgi:hypothetical protein
VSDQNRGDLNQSYRSPSVAKGSQNHSTLTMANGFFNPVQHWIWNLELPSGIGRPRLSIRPTTPHPMPPSLPKIEWRGGLTPPGVKRRSGGEIVAGLRGRSVDGRDILGRRRWRRP